MATSANAKIQIETGQTLHAYAAMTDSGDNTVFTITGGPLWSGKAGFEPSVRPNGIVTGRNIISTHADDDKVTIAGFTAYSKGVLQTVPATTATFTRPSTATKAKVYSVTMASDGTIAVVAGTISATTEFSATRDAAGGPPLLPVNSVEIGQIRVTSSTAAAVASSEIFQVVGTHTERYDYPVWKENNIGEGDAATVSAKKNAYIEFASALPDDHTAGVAKAVYIQYYSPVFSNVAKTMDFVPCEKTQSVSSTQYYGGTVGSVSESLGQGSFTALMDDNTTDTLIGEKNQKITTKFYPDENKTPYILTQGTIGLKRTFPVANQNQCSVTISSEDQSVEFAS